MMTRPRPTPPYLPIYPQEQWFDIQAKHEEAEREWQRETRFAMLTNSAMVLIAAAGLVVAALMGPQILVDAIRALAK